MLALRTLEEDWSVVGVEQVEWYSSKGSWFQL